MPMILKVVTDERSPEPGDNEHFVVADVMDCAFRRYPDNSGAEARLQIRDAIKTAAVPGFCEHEKLVSFTGVAYLMNETGRTISTFNARQPTLHPISAGQVHPPQ